jgi:calcineurin-like phosphoesterase family protein
VDIDDWAVAYPETEVVRLAGKAIYVLHDLKTLQINPIARGIDVVVSGHSHVPKIDTADGVLYLNPGSAGRRRFGLPITLATIDVTSGNLRPGNPRSQRRMNPPRGCVSSKRWQVQWGGAGRTARIRSPGETSPPSVTIAMTPALKRGPAGLPCRRFFNPDLKRSMRTQGVRRRAAPGIGAA